MADTKENTTSEEMEHATLGASASHRWMNCHGSVNMTKDLPDKTSEYAEEGTDAHALAEYCLEANVDAHSFVGQQIPEREAKATEEMADAVQLYLDVIRKDMAGMGSKTKMFVEHKFDIDPVNEDMFGTSDCGLTSLELLRVYDYKHGAGIPVNAANNSQLMFYAYGSLHTLAPKVEEVEIIVVQPRAKHPDGPVRRWRISKDDLYAWKRDVLFAAATEARKPDAPLSAGTWCRWCLAQAKCPEMARETLEIAQADFAEDGDSIELQMPDPQYLSDDKIRQMMEFAPILSSFVKTLEAFISERLMKGGNLEGYKLVGKRSNRTWNSESEAVAAMNDFFKTKELDPREFHLYEPAKLLTPAKVEKFKLGSNKKPFKEMLTAHYHKPEAGVTLAKESDSRPGVPPPASARQEFLAADLEKEDWFQ